MYSGFQSHCIPQYRLLTEAQLKRLHNATLELLETVGVRVQHEDARRMLADAGCRLDEKGMVRIPNWLVEDAIRSAPSRITIYIRLGGEAMRLEGRRIHFGLGRFCMKHNIMDTLTNNVDNLIRVRRGWVCRV